MTKDSELASIGWREWVALPDLGLPAIKAKIDTGARTSALHAFLIEPYQKDGIEMLRFLIHPIQRNQEFQVECHCPVYDVREVTDSGGHREMRYVIQSNVRIGTGSWPIELTLTNRDTMAFRMLLGRKAMENRFPSIPAPPISTASLDHASFTDFKTRTPMKIALLSRNRRLYSSRRIIEAAEESGHEIVVIDVLRAYMNIAAHKPSIHYRGEVLEGFDAVIPRIGASVTAYGLAVLRQFEMMGVVALNESVAIGRSRDKLRSLQLLSRRGIGMPLTGYANKPDDIKDVIKMVGGAPLVVKLLQGTQGIGVVLAETQKAAESVIEGFMGVKADILVQEFIKEAGGSDIRCFVIDGKVVAAMKRQAPKGEFRSNLHRGGSSSLIKITPEERSTAVRAARIMGLNVAGVDLLRSQSWPGRHGSQFQPGSGRYRRCNR